MFENFAILIKYYYFPKIKRFFTIISKSWKCYVCYLYAPYYKKHIRIWLFFPKDFCFFYQSYWLIAGVLLINNNNLLIVLEIIKNFLEIIKNVVWKSNFLSIWETSHLILSLVCGFKLLFLIKLKCQFN